MEVSQKYQGQLGRIKDLVRKAHDHFDENNKRFNEFRRFVFQRSLTEDDCTLLETIGRPQIEFNVLEAYISRLLGEFSKQEPSISVTARNPGKVAPEMVQLVDMHLRHGLSDARYERTKYEIYKDMLSGGFSVAKVRTEYVTPMSFDQEIIFERVFDPTMCGFDPLARQSHKGDGAFCFELFSMEKDRFETEYPDISVSQLSFRRDFAGFNWSYLNCNIEYLLVCDWYEKKPKKIRIVQLRDGRVMEMDKYKKMVEEWQGFELPPAVIGKPRWTTKDTICRYRLIENKVIEYEETDFTMLPLIFFDGSSILIKTPKNGNVQQFTRPYVYHAKGAQRLKNFAGISLANEIENTVQHKFMVAKEALPKEEGALQAYEDVQKANLLIYNAFDEQNPDKAIPNPLREVQRVPAPPEIAAAFTGSDSLIQNVLGSYDASLGINDNQLSGVAVVEAASQSNAAAMPYLVGFMHGLQRVAENMVSLYPKYYTTPRTIPVQDAEGKRGYVMINAMQNAMQGAMQQPGMQGRQPAMQGQQGMQPQQNMQGGMQGGGMGGMGADMQRMQTTQPNVPANPGVQFDYDEDALDVMVEAGAAFRVQKSKALQQIVALQGASPMFEQFMATKGLPILLDNLDIRGLDQIKEMANEWMQEMEQQKQQQQQMQQQMMQNNPALQKIEIDKAKIAQQGQKDAMQFQVDMEKLKQDQQKVLVDAQIEREKGAVQVVKAQTERFAKQVDLALKGGAHGLKVHDQHLKTHDMVHRHALDRHNAIMEANRTQQ